MNQVVSIQVKYSIGITLNIFVCSISFLLLFFVVPIGWRYFWNSNPLWTLSWSYIPNGLSSCLYFLARHFGKLESKFVSKFLVECLFEISPNIFFFFRTPNLTPETTQAVNQALKTLQSKETIELKRTRKSDVKVIPFVL